MLYHIILYIYHQKKTFFHFYIFSVIPPSVLFALWEKDRKEKDNTI